jgi:hypothetical protein
LLAAKQNLELEKLWYELEWRKCAQDAEYFIRNYVWIEVETRHDPRGRKLFDLWDYQESALGDYLNSRFVIVLKARQLGFTTLAMAYALWLCLFQPRANILLISKSQDAADKNLGMARFMYAFLPEWMKARGPELDGDAAKQIVFRAMDGSVNRIKSFAGTKTAGAGETASLVILDEFALMDDPSNTYRTIKPTTDAGGKLIIISTARGGSNMFARLYRDARRGINGFKAIFQPWTVSRLITQAEYEANKLNYAAEPWLFYMEYPSTDEEAFRESGRPRFANLPPEEDCPEFPVCGEFDEDPNTGEIIFRETEPGQANFYLSCPPEELDFQRQFVLSADPALGVGGDYSSAHVLSITEDGLVEIVGYYLSNTIEPGDWAGDLDLIGRYFTGVGQKAALLVPENAGGIGVSIIDKLRNQYNYPNLYRYLPPAVAKRRRAPVFGFPTTKATKPLVVNRLAEWLTPDQEGQWQVLNIYPRLRDELSTFVRRDNGSTAADVGCHDDTVMSLAIGLYVLLEECHPVERQTIGETPEKGVQLSVGFILEEAKRDSERIDHINRKALRRYQRGMRRRFKER